MSKPDYSTFFERKLDKKELRVVGRVLGVAIEEALEDFDEAEEYIKELETDRDIFNYNLKAIIKILREQVNAKKAQDTKTT